MTRRHLRHDAGFSLAEVLIALTLLALAALALADLIVRSARTVALARAQTVATTLAVDRLEQLLGLTWGFGDAEAPSPVMDTSTDLSGASPAVGGTGLAVGPAHSIDADTPGWVDAADGQGAWVGASAFARHTRFVRRWSVSAVSGGANARVLQVSVRTRAAAPDGGEELARLVAAKVPTAY
jgi:prepilin-type N-terminal cleavage/methylation domain-containing protein